MHSTTGELGAVGVPTASAAPKPRDITPGIDVLRAIVTMRSLPQDASAEREALAALRVIQKKDLKTPESKAAYDRLAADMCAMEPHQVEARLEWFRRRQRWWSPDRRSNDRRRSRGLMLFVLLALLAAPAMNATVLREVVARRILSGETEIEQLLKNLRVTTSSPEERELHRAYLDLFRELANQAAAGISPADLVSRFQRWGWTRRLLFLEQRRVEANLPLEVSGPPNPGRALEAGALEFELARMGEFSRLARQGGSLARASLAAMGYSDYRAPLPPAPGKRQILLVVLVACAVAATAMLWWRAREWDQDNQRFVRDARTALDARR